MARAPRLVASFLIAGLAASTAHAAAAQRSHDDLIDVARSAGAFGTLLAAVETAGLTAALQGDGPFTVFAPTDEAFDALPDGTVETLLKPENRARLRAILSYHVVPARVTAAQAASLRFAPTLNSQRVGIDTENGALRIGGSTVLQADLMAENGVLHVIDRVLSPQEQTVVGVAADAGTFSTLLAAAQAAGLDGPLASDGPFTVFAPTDEAFDALPEGTLEALLREQNVDQLRAILELHVVPARVYADQALDAGSARTLGDERVRFALAEGTLQVNGASILDADIEAANGVIHAIDVVLLPQMSTTDGGRAERLIRLAIQRGVPLFNRGDADACAAVYEVTMQALVDLGPELPEATRRDLRRTLRKAADTPSVRNRAWLLRDALDRALAALAS